MLAVFEPEALNYFNFFRPIPLTLSVSKNPILTYLPLLGFSALRSDCTHPRSGILSPDDTHACGGVMIFIRHGSSFSELSICSFFLPDHYSDYVEVNISLNNYSLLSFFNVSASPIRSSPTEGRTCSFSSSILFSSINFFILKDFNCHHPLWDSRGTSGPRGRKYSTVSSLLTSFSSMILTHLPFYIAPPSTPLLLPPLLPFLAPGRYFRTWVLTTYQFFCLSIFLRSFASTSVPLPLTFTKRAGMTLPPTLTPTVVLQSNTCLFLFLLQLLSLPL